MAGVACMGKHVWQGACVTGEYVWHGDVIAGHHGEGQGHLHQVSQYFHNVSLKERN